MDISAQIESILFFKGEAMTITKIGEILNLKEKNVEEQLDILKLKLQGRGVCLLRKDDKVMLGTSPEMSSFVEILQKEELSKELSRASLETLSLILYRGPISKTEIDYIRGVNSSSILRNLLVRGLIDKKLGARPSYSPSFDLMAFLGIGSLNEMPDFEKIRKEIEDAQKNLEKVTEFDTN